MSQSELLQNVITGLESLVESMKALASSLTLSDDFKQISPPVEESAPKEKSTEKKVTLVEVRGLLAELSQSGRTPEVKKLIAKYGGKKLSDIKEEQFNSLYKDAEVLKNAAD